MFWLCPRAPSCSHRPPGREQRCVLRWEGLGAVRGSLHPHPPSLTGSIPGAFGQGMFLELGSGMLLGTSQGCSWIPVRDAPRVLLRDAPRVSLRDAPGPAQPSLLGNDVMSWMLTHLTGLCAAALAPGGSRCLSLSLSLSHPM